MSLTNTSIKVEKICPYCGRVYKQARAFDTHVAESCPKLPSKTEHITLPLPLIPAMYNQSQWGVGTVYASLLSGKIDVNAEYQRGIVWTPIQQSKLIVSLYDNVVIMPVLLTRHADGHYVCVDGKQRLTAIKLFLDGGLSIKMAGKKLTAEQQDMLRKEIMERDISMIVYHNCIDETTCREIFNRVQNGMPLNNGEIINAAAGNDADIVKTVVTATESILGLYSTSARFHHYEDVTRMINDYYAIHLRPRENLSYSQLLTTEQGDELIVAIERAHEINKLLPGKPSMVKLRYILMAMRNGGKSILSNSDDITAFSDVVVKTITAAELENPLAFSSHSTAKNIKLVIENVK